MSLSVLTLTYISNIIGNYIFHNILEISNFYVSEQNYLLYFDYLASFMRFLLLIIVLYLSEIFLKLYYTFLQKPKSSKHVLK